VRDLHVLNRCRGCEGTLRLIDGSRAAGQGESGAALLEAALDDGEAAALKGVRHEGMQQCILDAMSRAAVQRGRPGDHD
jgi:hypothetical protein